MTPGYLAGVGLSWVLICSLWIASRSRLWALAVALLGAGAVALAIWTNTP